MWYIMVKNKLISPFFFEEAIVISDTFLDMMENTDLCHVSVGSFPVSWCTTSLLPSCCLSGQGVS
jgi:hypothetical protein